MRGFSARLSLLFLGAYLVAWPVALQPQAWTPTPARMPLAPRPLSGLQRFASSIDRGPTDLLFDAEGRLQLAYEDGRIVELGATLAGYRERGDTQGHPRGLALAPEGALWIADARRGLLRLDGGPDATVLTSAADGGPLRAVSAVAYAAREQALYVLDASSRHEPSEWRQERLEQRASGRLLRYDLVTHGTRVLLRELQRPGGLALGPDEACLVLAESGRRRLLRLWLAGPRAGEREIFADQLPGEPQQLSFNGADRYWLALAPRDRLLDALGPWPMLRRVLARLPPPLQPSPTPEALAMGFDTEGHVIAALRDTGDGAYAPLARVREHAGWLYLASPEQGALARLPLQSALPWLPAPAPGEPPPHRPQPAQRGVRPS